MEWDRETCWQSGSQDEVTRVDIWVLLFLPSKPAATVASGFASKLASAANGACGAIVEFASRLSEVIDGQMDFGPTQDILDTTTPRF